MRGSRGEDCHTMGHFSVRGRCSVRNAAPDNYTRHLRRRGQSGQSGRHNPLISRNLTPQTLKAVDQAINKWNHPLDRLSRSFIFRVRNLSLFSFENRLMSVEKFRNRFRRGSWNGLRIRRIREPDRSQEMIVEVPAYGYRR
jgi:hypothetical protein